LEEDMELEQEKGMQRRRRGRIETKIPINIGRR
jgi:hypothetical protein